MDVTCLETCHVRLIPRDAFAAILQDNPQVYFAVAKVLSSDLNIADNILRTYARRSGPRIRNRVSKPV
jgi:CRP-like cAMP-binding protein